jgi:hypothetical protein
MSGQTYCCPSAPWQGQSLDTETIKRQGWRDQGLLVISPEDQRLDWMERQLLTQIAERLYGRRTVRHG